MKSDTKTCSQGHHQNRQTHEDWGTKDANCAVRMVVAGETGMSEGSNTIE